MNVHILNSSHSYKNYILLEFLQKGKINKNAVSRYIFLSVHELHELYFVTLPERFRSDGYIRACVRRVLRVAGEH